MASLIFDVAKDTVKLVKKYNNKLLIEQATAQSEALSGKHIIKLKEPGVLGTVNIRAGGNTSTGQIDDGGATTYTSSDPKQLHYYPKVFFGGLRFGRMLAKQMKSPREGVRLVQEESKNEMERLGALLGKAVFSSKLADVATATTANTSTTTTVTDASGFEIGMTVDVYDDSDGFVEQVTITKIAFDDDYDNATTLTFTGSGTGGACANSWTSSPAYYFRLKGSVSGSTDMDTIENAASATAPLYGQAVTAYNWFGNTKANMGSLSLDKLDQLAVLHSRRRKKDFDRVFMDRVNARRYVKLADSLKRFTPAGGDLRGETSLAYDGVKIVVDENVGNSKIFLINRDDVKLHCFSDFAPDDDEMSKMHLAEGTYDWLLPISGHFALRVERRTGCSVATGITG